MNVSDLGIKGLKPVGSSKSRKAEDYINGPDIELQWAKKAYEHAETYFSLLSAVNPSLLKLTRIDDIIYGKFKETFPDFKIDLLVEDELKSYASKEKWRPFCEEFKQIADDYNYGTLIRLDCNRDYAEDNTLLVLRIQFLAIEIARNREEMNSQIRFTFGNNITSATASTESS